MRPPIPAGATTRRSKLDFPRLDDSLNYSTFRDEPARSNSAPALSLALQRYRYREIPRERRPPVACTDGASSRLRVVSSSVAVVRNGAARLRWLPRRLAEEPARVSVELFERGSNKHTPRWPWASRSSHVFRNREAFASGFPGPGPLVEDCHKRLGVEHSQGEVGGDGQPRDLVARQTACASAVTIAHSHPPTSSDLELGSGILS